MLFFDIDIPITTNGTGAGAVLFSLSVASDSGSVFLGSFRENAVVGTMGQIGLGASTTAVMFTYNNAYPGGTGYRLFGAGSYRMASVYS